MPVRRFRVVLAALALSAILAACSGSGSAPPAPTIGPSVVPSVVPSAPQSPTATATATQGSAPAGPSVTLADDRSTVTLTVGERFLLNLGAEFDWTVLIADPAILVRVPNISVILGAQGLYEARAKGRTTLSAVGDPPCRKSTPPCAAPSRSFEVEVVVR